MNVRSKRGRGRARLTAILVAVVGCQSPTDVEVADLKGTWVASQVRILDIELPKEFNFDLIELGYGAVFSSPGNGDFTLRLAPPEGEPQYIVGSLATDRTDITITTNQGVSSGEVFLEGEQIALSLTAGLTYDFAGKGVEKPAKLLLVMDRESLEAASL